MPKNSTLDNVKRLIALDAALVSSVYVPAFAKEWGVSTKTIRRDLAMLRQLGERMIHKRFEGGEVLDMYWRYERGVKPLFACNATADETKRPRPLERKARPRTESR